MSMFERRGDDGQANAESRMSTDGEPEAPIKGCHLSIRMLSWASCICQTLRLPPEAGNPEKFYEGLLGGENDSLYRCGKVQ